MAGLVTSGDEFQNGSATCKLEECASLPFSPFPEDYISEVKHEKRGRSVRMFIMTLTFKKALDFEHPLMCVWGRGGALCCFLNLKAPPQNDLCDSFEADRPLECCETGCCKVSFKWQFLRIQCSAAKTTVKVVTHTFPTHRHHINFTTVFCTPTHRILLCRHKRILCVIK